MPFGVYSDLKCGNKKHPPFTPTKHQTDVLNYFLVSKYKGILLYHELGSGKTCTSILIADEMLKSGMVEKVVVFSPGSLRTNFIEEYCRVCGDPKNMKNNFIFVTYNYNVEKNLPPLDNCLVIIDETHNLINGYKNQSKTAVAIYNTINTSNCRIIALTGTPVLYYIYEWALLANLLKPNSFPEIVKKGNIDPQAFTNLFITDENGSVRPKNPAEMRSRLNGIVSFFPGSGTEYYPEVTHMPPIKAEMPPPQEENYWRKYLLEKSLRGEIKEDSKRVRSAKWDRLKIMAKKFILTRGASNFYYTEEIVKKPDLLVTEKGNVEEDEDEGKEEGKDEGKDEGKEEGWIDREAFRNQSLLKIHSTKIAALLINIVSHPHQKHVLFTFFKKKYGVNLIHSIMKMCGIKSEIFSGDLNDRQRKSILNTFNSTKNRYGKYIQILLVTEAGAEGISILEGRHVHILESSPREVRIQQAIGRVVRFKSHSKMPENERNVKVWRYWSTASHGPFTIYLPNRKKEKTGGPDMLPYIINDKQTVDELLYERGQRQLNAIKSFLQILQESSVTKYKKR